MKRLACLIAGLLIVSLLMFMSVVGAQEQNHQQDHTWNVGAQQQDHQWKHVPQRREDRGVQAMPVSSVVPVSIGDGSFDPNGVTVEPGTAVVWTNEGQEPHTVTADDGSFDSGALEPGKSFMVVVSGSGTLTYHCAIHPEMVGSVDVVDASPSDVPAEESTVGEAAGEDTSGGIQTGSGTTGPAPGG